MDKTFEGKSKKIFSLFFLCFCIIFVKILLLCTLKRSNLEKIAKSYQQKTIHISPQRGTIRDKLNRALAINKLCLEAKILFDPIKRLPRYTFQIENKKKKKIYYRKKYINKLSEFLSQTLKIDAQEIKDLIYSKAVIFPNTPFSVKSSLDEATYYYLKARAKDWPGLELHLSSKRDYPQKTLMSHLIGYMGQVSLNDFLSIKSETQALKEYLKQKSLFLPIPLLKGYTSTRQIQERLEYLQKKGYLMNTKVGRNGLEKMYEKDLRGFLGKKKYAIDCKSNQLRELPNNETQSSGRRVFTTINLELQEYAEKLLVNFHHTSNKTFENPNHRYHKIAPWQRKSALIAMDPTTGEIVAMASTPGYDPNDFENNNLAAINKALESRTYIASLFNGLTPLDENMYLPINSKYLSFDLFLERILSRNSNVKKKLHEARFIKTNIAIQKALRSIIKATGASAKDCINAIFSNSPNIKTFNALKKEDQDILEKQIIPLKEETKTLIQAMQGINNNHDKLLFLDLLRLNCKASLFSDALIEKTKSLTLNTFFQINQEALRATEKLELVLGKTFEKTHFLEWKKQYFAQYLKEKRKEERINKKCVKPYTDYLDQVKKELFSKFFAQHKKEFIYSFFTQKIPTVTAQELKVYFLACKNLANENKELSLTYLRNLMLRLEKTYAFELLDTLRGFENLTSRLLGRYYSLRSGKNSTLQDLALSFYPQDGFGYTKSLAFQDNTALGSIFKIVTGYEALRQNILKQESSGQYYSLNPFTITDLSPPYSQILKPNSILGYKNGQKICRRYKGGRMPRGTPNIGKVTLQEAFERSSNIYFSILASDYLHHPDDLSNCATTFGFGQKTGIDLQCEAKGQVPTDLTYNISNLFTFAIGHHTLTVTPLQVACFLSALANKGALLQPNLVNLLANLEPIESNELEFHTSYPYKKALKNIGINFALFSEANHKKLSPFVQKKQSKVRRNIYCPDELRDYLFDGLHLVTNSNRGSARSSNIGSLWRNPLDLKIYRSVQQDIIGKTGTAEFCYKPWLDREQGAILAKQTWFTTISFKDKRLNGYEKPELVVVAISSFSNYGKELAPITAKIIHKYRNLKKHNLLLKYN